MRHIQKKMWAFAIIFTFIAVICYEYFNHTYIKVEFKKTDPMPAKMGVYYKGYKLGNTTRLKIAKDFSRTYLYITLNQRGLYLPKNIKAKVKDYDNDTKFVDLIYPKRPAIKQLKTGDTIMGVSDLNRADGISNTNQAHIDNLSIKGEMMLSSAKETADTLTDLLSLIYDILSENRQNINSSSASLKKSMKNLELTTSNLKTISQKFDNEVTETTLKNSVNYIEETAKNLSQSSKELNGISENVNRTSKEFSTLVPRLENLIKIGITSLYDLDHILTGIGQTLQKRAGGMRVLFGVPIKD